MPADKTAGDHLVSLREVLETVGSTAPPDSYFYARDAVRFWAWQSAIRKVGDDLRARFDPAGEMEESNVRRT